MCNRLGASLALYKAEPSAHVSATEFALQRLRLDGIDPENWAPAS